MSSPGVVVNRNTSQASSTTLVRRRLLYVLIAVGVVAGFLPGQWAASSGIGSPIAQLTVVPASRVPEPLAEVVNKTSGIKRSSSSRVAAAPTVSQQLLSSKENSRGPVSTDGTDAKLPSDQSQQQYEGDPSFGDPPPEIMSPLKLVERSPREEGSVGADGKRSYLRDLEGRPVDFLTVIMPVYWCTALMVRDINSIHRPRYIWFLAVDEDSCPILEKMAPNVRCIQEQEIFHRHWSAETLSKLLANKKRAGWYYYQQLNYQVSFTLSELSETYIVWDADTLPTSNELRFFDYDKKKVIYHMNDENMEAPAAMSYHRSYEILTGLRTEHSPHINYVAHFMPFRKKYAREIVQQVAAWRGVPLHHWMVEVTKTFRIEYLGTGRVESGFADYQMFGSWVATFHSQTMMLQVDWWKDKHERYPLRKGGLGPDYVRGNCVPGKRLYESFQQKMWTVTYELAKADPACGQVPYQPEMVDFTKAAPAAVSWALTARPHQSPGPLPVHSPPTAIQAACMQQWSLLGRNKRKLEQLWRRLPPNWKGGEQGRATSNWRQVDAPYSSAKGAWFRQIAEDNTMIYMAYGGKSTWVSARRNLWAASFKSIRDPAFGNWSGPIVVVCSEAAELMQWLSRKETQEWVKCRSYATTQRAAKTLPSIYGGPEDNPCAISFIRYRISWYSEQQDYRRLKMAVHEVMDLENDRRMTTSSIASDGTVVPAIEHAVYLDAGTTASGPISKHLAFLRKKYRGQALTIREQPGESGTFHGGLWHTHLYLGRNLTRTWQRMYDLGSVRWEGKTRIRDQPALRRSLMTLALTEEVDRPKPKLDGSDGTCEKRMPHVDIALQCFDDPSNPYPDVCGKDKKADEPAILIHWSGFCENSYHKYMSSYYEPYRKALGAPDFMEEEPKPPPDDEWKPGPVEVPVTTLYTVDNVKWSLKDAKGKPLVVVLEPREVGDKLQEVLNGVLMFFQPIYVVVLVQSASTCERIRQMAADMDELLCEAPQGVTQLDSGRNYGYGGRSEPMVAQRAVLCEVSSAVQFVKESNPAYSDYLLLWDDTAVPLPAMKELASDVLFDSNGDPSFYVASKSGTALTGEDACRAHAPWLLARIGSDTFLKGGVTGEWRSAFERSEGCATAVVQPKDFKSKGHGKLWK
eukprot:TRINITY_DN6482_c0_g1_i1.p1 TRINITY_DN6482_c0_g1~~TRINITY_DN6482_c0_g1_i1.p1  ORF type:complete len:1142 (+),score=167.28 TRINITY_DN6482_c0_g1_i1:200-3625(+)